MNERGEERITSDHGVMVLRNRTPLFKEEGGFPFHFSRLSLREVWDELTRFKFKRGEDRLDAVIVGAPGSGKSRSIVYGLKKLFEARRTVVVELRRDGTVFAFVPTKRGDQVEYEAWRCSTKDFDEANCAALMNEDACYIMDAVAKDPKRPGILGAQRIMVTSPEPNNYENMRKEHAEIFFTPPWTLEEMCVLQEHWSGPMGTKVDRAELLRRFYILGGIPRHVFETVNEFKSAASLLLGDALKLSAQEAHNVLTGKVSPEDFSGDKTFRSKLASFFPTPPYRTSKIDFVSPYTRALALSHAYETLLNATQRPPGDKLFEQAALGLLARSGSLLAKRLPYTKLSSKRKLYETIKFERGTHLPQVAVTQADFVSAARKLKAEAELEPDEAGAPLLVPGVGNQPAVDAADARDRFYQITQAPKHVITCKAIKELYTDENGAKRKIKLIFVVHPASKLSSAQEFKGSDEEKREAMQYVEQFVAKVFEPARVLNVALPPASAASSSAP